MRRKMNKVDEAKKKLKEVYMKRDEVRKRDEALDEAIEQLHEALYIQNMQKRRGEK